MTDTAEPARPYACQSAPIPAPRQPAKKPHDLIGLEDINWSMWSVVLLKPDCIDRSLCIPILDTIADHLTIVDHRHVTPTWEQISYHYDDMLEGPRAETITWCDAAADIRQRYVGTQSGIALVYGPDAPARMRALLGHFDPAQADPDSIRGRYGTDSAERAVREGRMTRNLIHSSDHEEGALKEFTIWYGADSVHLLNHQSSARR